MEIPPKRNATYHFFAKHLNLSLGNVTYPNGTINESPNTMESEDVIHTFNSTNVLPSYALLGECEVLTVLKQKKKKQARKKN